MEKVTYQCTLLSDIILSSNSATEEAQEALDYIPGSKFLGIVANQFLKNPAPEANEEFTKLFLSDKVRFGNAYPLLNNQPSFPIPLCWYDDKNKKDPNIYQIHQVSNTKKRELIQHGTQLKQRRKGYFNLAFEELNEMNQKFYLKSAYDSENRRSEDGKMFGYYALAAGSAWQFDIEYDSNISIANIEKFLIGKKRIGRSRSAEFGLIEIEKSNLKPGLITQNNDTGKETIVYAYANLCFYNAFGVTTGTPTPDDLGLPVGSEILWEKSQIRTRLYQSWNRKRFNRDADRLIVVKGSVFVCKVPENKFSASEIWLGRHFSEGFGKALINPSFIPTGELLSHKLKDIKSNDLKIISKYVTIVDTPVSNNFSAWYASKSSHTGSDLDILEHVLKAKEESKNLFKNISPSQWGKIRSYASYAGNKTVLKMLLFDEHSGCLHHGQAQSVWRGEKMTFLENLIDTKSSMDDSSLIQFVVRFAAEMGKTAQK